MNAWAGLADSIKSFLEIKTSRNLGGRNAALNFGTSEDPKYVILNRIQPDVAQGAEYMPSEIVNSEKIGSPQAFWVSAGYASCSTTSFCSEGVESALFKCVNDLGVQVDEAACGDRPADMDKQCFVRNGCQSCKQLVELDPSTPSGEYVITGSSAARRVWCDMDHDGGGWTLVARQIESCPMAWSGGVCGGTYSPRPDSGGFTLLQGNIPPHGEVAFGKDGSVAFIAWFDMAYSTGNIMSEGINKNDGQAYYVHRSSSGYYSGHDTERGWTSDANSVWRNTLSVDLKIGGGTVWAFSPYPPLAYNRGFQMGGNTAATNDSYGWTVWVR
jgi:hypothetical protein